MKQESGWKPLPLSLKLLTPVIALWTLGSIMAVSMRYDQGLPLLGMFIFGIPAVLVVLTLDIIAPLAFLYGTWKRLSWAPKVGMGYNAVFILNSLAALTTVRAQLGVMPILMPTLFSAVFLVTIYSARKYYA